MTKLDYKKQYKDLYLPSHKEPALVTVPTMNFLMIDGQGDPNNNETFQKAVEALYSLSYGIKMLPKKGIVPEGYFDYVVPPLEGLWWIDGEEFSFHKRDNWLWTLMIRQPEFVTLELYEETLNRVKSSKDNESLSKLKFESFEEGLCVQMMHIGTYASEPETVDMMDKYMESNGYRVTFQKGGKHHEIYLSDPNKAKPETMKTVLRHPVEKV